MPRSTCPTPSTCTAAMKGPCKACHPHAFDAAREGRERYWTDQQRAEQSAVMTAQHADPAFKAVHAENSRRIVQRLHADPAFKERARQRSRQLMVRLHRDPAFAAKLDRARRRHGAAVPA